MQLAAVWDIELFYMWLRTLILTRKRRGAGQVTPSSPRALLGANLNTYLCNIVPEIRPLRELLCFSGFHRQRLRAL